MEIENRVIDDVIKNYGPVEDRPYAMEGWCSTEKACAIFNAAITSNAKRIVEIGVFGGKSLFALAAAAKLKSGHVDGIDSWSNDDSAIGMEGANLDWWRKVDMDHVKRSCEYWINALGFSQVVSLYQEHAADGMHRYRDKPIDLLHVDGNHSEWDSQRDVFNWTPLVRPGGCIVFDDLEWPTTKKAQKLLAEVAIRKQTITVGSCECGIYQKHSNS